MSAGGEQSSPHCMHTAQQTGDHTDTMNIVHSAPQDGGAYLGKGVTGNTWKAEVKVPGTG